MCLGTLHDQKKTYPNDSSTTYCEYSTWYLKPIALLFFVQLFFWMILPTIDTFIDLGTYFSSDGYYSHLGVHDDDTICCPGAGFSGFWFSLGRLRSIVLENSGKKNGQNISLSEAPIDGYDLALKEFYDHEDLVDISLGEGVKFECFSAGCIGVVAILMDLPIEYVLDCAQEAQTLWREGKISQFLMVEHFVDGLIGSNRALDKEGQLDLNLNIITKDNRRVLTKDMLSRINVITAARGKGMQVQTVSRTALNMDELRELLIQTSWIPFVTGKSLWRRDHASGKHYMDGAFTAFAQPRCRRNLGLPFQPDLLMNALNVNLERSKAERFYEEGLNYKPSYQ